MPLIALPLPAERDDLATDQTTRIWRQSDLGSAGANVRPRLEQPLWDQDNVAGHDFAVRIDMRHLLAPASHREILVAARVSNPTCTRERHAEDDVGQQGENTWRLDLAGDVKQF